VWLRERQRRGVWCVNGVSVVGLVDRPWWQDYPDGRK